MRSVERVVGVVQGDDERPQPGGRVPALQAQPRLVGKGRRAAGGLVLRAASVEGLPVGGDEEGPKGVAFVPRGQVDVEFGGAPRDFELPVEEPAANNGWGFEAITAGEGLAEAPGVATCKQHQAAQPDGDRAHLAAAGREHDRTGGVTRLRRAGDGGSDPGGLARASLKLAGVTFPADLKCAPVTVSRTGRSTRQQTPRMR